MLNNISNCFHQGGAIWLNPFTTVLFNVCSTVTVECCIFYLCRDLVSCYCTLFYCLLDQSCGECDVIYPCVLCVALLIDLFVLCVCELFCETIHNIFASDCYFVVECYGSV